MSFSFYVGDDPVSKQRATMIINLFIGLLKMLYVTVLCTYSTYYIRQNAVPYLTFRTLPGHTESGTSRRRLSLQYFDFPFSMDTTVAGTVKKKYMVCRAAVGNHSRLL